MRALSLAISFLLLLSGCGGGAENYDALTKSTKGTTLGIRIVNATGVSTHTITEDQPVTVIATLKNSAKKPVSNAVVDFRADLGVMDPATGSVLTDANGEARIKIRASSQTGAANVTASTTHDGESISVQTGYSVVAKQLGEIKTPTSTVNNSSDFGSIDFVSASPTTIVLKGTGGTGMSETSVVTFLVRGNDGKPFTGQAVKFELNTEIGGLSLSQISGTTDSEGKVSTIVRAGTVPTSVRVTATVETKTATNALIRIFTQSDMLVLSTGIPDQNSFSLAASNLNPEGGNYDGEEVVITAFLADLYNNPVPDGTAVYFTAEGGAIQSNCITKEGSCQVKWISQNPRPADHRVTILAHAIGNESFTDKNSDGMYSDGDGEPFKDANFNNVYDAGVSGESYIDVNGNSVFDGPGFSDLGEAFLDANENGRHDNGELYFDTNSDGVFSEEGDGKYTGNMCADGANCSAHKTVHVRGSLVLVLASSYALVNVVDAKTDVLYASNLPNVPAPSDVLNIDQVVQNLLVTATDTAGQILPSGTTIEISTTLGRVLGPSKFTVINTSDSRDSQYAFAIADEDKTTIAEGKVTLKIVSPHGVETVLVFPIKG